LGSPQATGFGAIDVMEKLIALPFKNCGWGHQ